jgi:hypothetical protein
MRIRTLLLRDDLEKFAGAVHWNIHTCCRRLQFRLAFLLLPPIRLAVVVSSLSFWSFST